MPSPEDQARLDAFFAEADDILEHWEPGFDSATWAADGSHQPDEISGRYYGDDVYRSRGLQGQSVRLFVYDEVAAFAQAPTLAELESGDAVEFISSVSTRSREMRQASRRAPLAMQQLYYANAWEVTFSVDRAGAIFPADPT